MLRLVAIPQNGHVKHESVFETCQLPIRDPVSLMKKLRISGVKSYPWSFTGSQTVPFSSTIRLHNRTGRPFSTRLLSITFAGLAASLVLGLLTSAADARTAASRSGLNAAFDTAETASGNFLAAIIAGSKQDIGPAARFYSEALKTDPANKDILDRAFLTALADGNMPEAFRFADQLLKRDPNAALPNMAIAVRNIKNRQFAAARRSLTRGAGKFRTADPLIALVTAWTYVGEGRAAKGIDFADKLAIPGSTDIRNYMTGLMADISGNKDEAIKRMAAAYEADKNNISGADAYGRIQARLGDRQVAIKVYEDALALVPNEPQLAVPLADIKANRIPEPVVKSSVEGAAQVFYFQAGTRVRPGEEVLPLIYMQIAKYLSPDDDHMPFALGEGFAALNQHERAIGYFDAIGENSVFHRRSMIRKAFSLESIEKTDEAITTLNQLVASKEADLESLNSLGILLRVKKRWPEAIAAYSKALDQIGKPSAPYWSLYHGRGMCFERNKEWSKGEADLKIALDLLPDDPKLGPVNGYNRAQVLNYLAYSWVDQGLNIGEAFPMLKRAVELTEGRDGYIIDSLGWAFYRQNQFDDAVRELERASAIKPSDPVINDHLGDAYWKVGRKLEAQFQWNHARDLKPEPDDLSRILKKIENGLEEQAPANSAATQNPPKPDGG